MKPLENLVTVKMSLTTGCRMIVKTSARNGYGAGGGAAGWGGGGG